MKNVKFYLFLGLLAFLQIAFLSHFENNSSIPNLFSLAFFAIILQLTTSRIFPKDAAFRLLATFYFIGLLLYELIYFIVVFLSSYIDSQAFVSFGDIFRLSLILQIFYSLVLLYPIIYISKRVLLNFDEK